MTTPPPTPPPGYRLLTPEELTKPLPEDAMLWDDLEKRWIESRNRGEIRRPLLTYATATPPPTDWRKLVEELATNGDRLIDAIQSVQDWNRTDVGEAIDELNATLNRAKAALEETK